MHRLRFSLEFCTTQIESLKLCHSLSLTSWIHEFESGNTQPLLNAISELLLNPHSTTLIMQTCRPLLMDLVARWNTKHLNQNERNHDLLIAFSILLPNAPQLLW